MRLTAPKAAAEEVPTAGSSAWTPVGASAWTPVGMVGSPFLARVDAAGRVAPAGSGWHLGWWVGAEDRWYVAGEERAVRQGLVDGSPVVETWMRIPGGDAVQRTWAVPGAGGPLAVVEVENASPVPVALALVLVPGGVGGGSGGRSRTVDGPRRIELLGRELRIDGELVLVLAKEPNRAVGSSSGDDELKQLVMGGDASGAVLEPVVSGAGTAAVALVVPLPHTARFRLLLPLGGAGLRGEVADVPDADAVARGWAAQTDRGARVEVPDDRLEQATTAARRQLLLWAQASGDLPFASAAGVASALARWGAGEEAAAVLAELTERPEAARRLSRRSRQPAARAAWVDAVERVRDAIGDDALAERLGGAPKGTARTSPRTPTGDVRQALEALTSASPTWTWGHDGDADPAATAAFLGLVCDAVVHETADGLALLPHVPDSWRGQGIEVHDLPTRHGSLSFAVRWHGERPALLWELAPTYPEVPTRLVVPGLDPTWSTDGAKGEDLLAVPATAPSLDPGGSFS